MENFNEFEQKAMTECDKCSCRDAKGNCMAISCEFGIDQNNRDWFIETEIWNKMFKEPQNKACRHNATQSIVEYDKENDFVVISHRCLYCDRVVKKTIKKRGEK